MLRKTLTILSLVGLLLSVGLGWRSCYGKIGYVDANGNDLYALNNSLRLGRVTWEKIPASERGFYYLMWRHSTDTIQVSMRVPMAFFAICFLYFFLSLRPYRRRKRKQFGLCVKCGYDLRGSKERCPECGTAMRNTEALGTMAAGHDKPNHT